VKSKLMVNRRSELAENELVGSENSSGHLFIDLG
jgi:hypothetical protein